MASPVKLYQQEIHDNLGFFATWLPGDQIEVGDVGVIEGGGSGAKLRYRNSVFLVLSLPASRPKTFNTRQRMERKSRRLVARPHLILPEPKSRSISRTREPLFSTPRASDSTNSTTCAAVAEKVLKNKKWKKEWFLVEGIHTAGCATVIVSETDSASLVLVANAEAPIPGVSLADPKIGLTVSATRGKIFHVLGGKNLHPLYACLQLKLPIFGKPILKPVRGIAAAADKALPFFRPGVEVLLNS